jgi:raffinose/stachyose/melibiose transport system permease protein
MKTSSSRAKSKVKYRSVGTEVAAFIVTFVIFIFPFLFILFTAGKDAKSAFKLEFSMPDKWYLWENLLTVIQADKYLILRATYNTLVLTFFSVTLLVIISGMTGYVIQRKTNKSTSVAGFLVLTALIIPPAIVPTIWVLQKIGLYKTMTGMVLIEVAYGMAFAILIFRNFVATIPRELDEAAIIDGCSGWSLYFRIIFPLLKPVTVTIVIIATVSIFNDFVNPLYFLPGEKNATLQQTLYNFQGRYTTQWHLLFADILYITIFPLIAFIFFNKKIIAGMTAGSVKG